MSGFDGANIVGRILGDGRWTVRQLLDDGEFGQTYLADDAELDAEVLLRFPAPRLRADAAYCRRFSSTVEMLYTSQPMQYLPVIDVATVDGCPISVVQFTAHHTLADEMGPAARPAPSVVEDICSWLPTVCAGLDELHAKKIWHRDLRPGTLWRSISGQVWIGDVSLSQVVTIREQLYGRQLTDTGLAFGTPEYMAPELIIGVRYNGAVDQYALCATLFELIASRPAYVGSSPTAVLLAHTREPVPDLASMVPDVDPDLADLLIRGMAKEPQDRFPSCLAFAQAFLSTVRGEPIPEQTLERARSSGVFDRPITAESTYSEFEEAVESDTPPPTSSKVSTARIPQTVTAGELTSQPEPRRWGRWLMVAVILVGLGAGGWFGWRQITDGGTAAEVAQPIARKPVSREGQKRLKSQLKRPLADMASAETIEAAFQSLAKQAGVESSIDVEALIQAGARPSDPAHVKTSGRTSEQALHQLINGNSALRVMIDTEGKRLVLTTETPTERAGLSALPLGSLANLAPLAEQLQLPVDKALAGKPLDEALATIRDAARINVQIDQAALLAAGIEPGPVPDKYRRDEATAQEALTELTKAYGNLETMVDEAQRKITITTVENAKQSGAPTVAGIQPPPVPDAQAGASSKNSAAPVRGTPDPTATAAANQPAAAGNVRNPAVEGYRPPPEPIVQLANGVSLEPREMNKNGLGTEFLLVTPGECLIGAPDDSPFADADEHPEHLVKVSRPYWIGQTEVTLREFRAVLERDPLSVDPERLQTAEFDDAARRPVTYVSWFDAIEYCNELSRREKLALVYELKDVVRNEVGTITAGSVTYSPGLGYRLPTEAEWEFACRAGARYAEELSDPEADLESVGWFGTNSSGWLQPVGKKTPNRWGLVDMLGNVREWTFDSYEADAYERSGLYDPVATADLPERVVRGGSFEMPAQHLRSTAREPLPSGHADSSTGFRVVRSAE